MTLRRWLGCSLLFGALAACGASPTIVVVSLVPENEAARPSYVLVDWIGPDGKRHSQRLPSDGGDFAADGNPLAAFRAELRGQTAGERKVRALGMGPGGRVSWAAARIPWAPGQEQQVTLTLRRELADSNGDGWPDVIDDVCPGPGCRGDAGAPDAAVKPGDAEPDTSVDVPAQRDVAAPPDAGPGLPDAGLDAAPPDGASELQRGLLLHWALDETSGTMVLDSSGRGHHGTYNSPNPPTPSTQVPAALAAWSPRSLAFTMADRNLVVIEGMPASLKPPVMTLSAWYRATAVDTYGSDIMNGADVYVLRLGFDGAYVVKRTAGKWERCAGRRGDHLDGQWHHLAGVIAADTLTLYFDGVEVCSRNLATTITYDRGSNLTVGGHSQGSSGFDFGGHLDDLRLYERVLSEAEVRALAAGVR